MQFSLRPARTDDQKTIVEFNLAMAWESEGKELNQQVLAAGVAAVLADPDKGFYLMAEGDGRPAGSLMVTYEWSDWRNGCFWWIQSVYSAPNFRRQGVYSLMHDWVRQAALADDQACGLRLYVEKRNFGAQATYRKLGMVQTDYDLYQEEFRRGL